MLLPPKIKNFPDLYINSVPLLFLPNFPKTFKQEDLGTFSPMFLLYLIHNM